MMAITHHTINRNMAQVRMMYFQALLKATSTAPDNFWEDTCISFLEDNNNILGDNKFKGFSYNGEYYPPSIRRQRKTELMRSTAKLDDSLVTDFEHFRTDYEVTWATAKRAFKNLLNKTLSLAKSELELSLIVPQNILNSVEIVDFLPYPNALGLTVERAEELKKQYPEIKYIQKMEALGAIT